MNLLANITLPRDHIVSTLEVAVASHALVVLTAPMGYGKTTVARELADTMSEQVFYVSIPYGSHNALYLWGIIFRDLAAQGLETAKKLEHIGFPTDALHMQRVLDLFISYNHPLFLVLDDYHFVQDRRMDTFLEALVRAEIPNVHILLISRFRPDLPLEDMRIKGLVSMFGQNVLAFSQDEAVAYFHLHGSHDELAAKSAWKFTEGWAAALWLSLQCWHSYGTIKPVHDIEALLSETVFASYDIADQIFLLQLSVLGHFTPRQAAAISGDTSAPRRLRQLHNQNAFISYTPASDCYKLHSIFRTFLAKRLAEQPEDSVIADPTSAQSPEYIDKPKLYRRAGEWFAMNNAPVAAIRFFSQAGRDEDLLRILEVFAASGDGLLIAFDPEGIPAILQSIPWRVRTLCPLGWLSFVCYYIIVGSNKDKVSLLAEIEERFATNEAIAPAMRQRIKGELAFVRGVFAFNDLAAMRDIHAEAHALLQGQRSIIAKPRNIWTFGSPHMAFAFLREPGTYNQLLDLLDDHLRPFQEMTGTAIGGDILFRAEWLLETGALDKVEPFLLKALHMVVSKEQLAGLVMVYFTLGRLRLVQGKVHEAKSILEGIRPQIERADNMLLSNFLDLAMHYIATTSGDIEQSRLWMSRVNLTATNSLYQGANFARIIYGKSLVLMGDWARLEVFAEEIPEHLGRFRNLFGYIHGLLLRAVSAMHLHGQARAIELLRQAVELARPDGIVGSIAEYGSHILPLLRRMQSDNPEDIFLKKLLKAAKGYAFTALGEGELLAPQEQAVMEKIVQNMSSGDIAEALGIKQGTVRNTLSRVYTKLGVKTRAHAVEKWRSR